MRIIIPYPMDSFFLFKFRCRELLCLWQASSGGTRSSDRARNTPQITLEILQIEPSSRHGLAMAELVGIYEPSTFMYFYLQFPSGYV